MCLLRALSPPTSPTPEPRLDLSLFFARFCVSSLSPALAQLSPAPTGHQPFSKGFLTLLTQHLAVWAHLGHGPSQASLPSKSLDVCTMTWAPVATLIAPHHRHAHVWIGAQPLNPLNTKAHSHILQMALQKPCSVGLRKERTPFFME